MNNQLNGIVAVVLAAGQSRRMGRAKLLLPFVSQSKESNESHEPLTILDKTLLNLKRSEVDHILLVSGGYRDKVEAIAERQSVPSLFNPNYETGEMLSSLQVAVRFLLENHGTELRGMMVFLGDMPFVAVKTINMLIEEFNQRPNPVQILIPTYEGKAGHPVTFSNRLLTQLLALEQGKAPRDLIKGKREVSMQIDVSDAAVLLDIDTPAEYSAAMGQSQT